MVQNDELLVLAFGLVVLFLLSLHRRETVADLVTRIDKAWELVKAEPLRLIELTGDGFTKLENEVQLANTETSILYTLTTREDGETYETAHIRLYKGAYIAISRLNGKVVVLGGNTKNYKDPQLPYKTKVKLAKIFSAIREVAA